MDCSTPGLPVLPYLLELAWAHVHCVHGTIQPPHLLPPPSPFAFSLSQSFLMSQLFTSGGQSIGASTSASVLPMNIQGWFRLGLVWSPYGPRDSQESSPALQFESINSNTRKFVFQHQAVPQCGCYGGEMLLQVNMVGSAEFSDFSWEPSDWT